MAKKRLSQNEYKQQQLLEQQRKDFFKKIEEDALGISRINLQKSMRFMTFRIIKFVLIGLILLTFFIYSPLVMPLTLLLALTFIPAKQIEKVKNKNVNKTSRIKINKIDSIIAIALVVLTLGYTGYQLVSQALRQAEFSNKTQDELVQELTDMGVPSDRISQMVSRISSGDGFSGNRYSRIAISAFTLNTGERNIFTGAGYWARRGFGGGVALKIKPPPTDGEGGGAPTKFVRKLPLDAVFNQIANAVFMLLVLLMLVISAIATIKSFKYGEIKLPSIDQSKYISETRNSPCPCGSGKKRKSCCFK